MPERRPDYRWLIQRRREIQETLLALYELVEPKERRDRLGAAEKHRRAFGLLVGAAFSLWRAAFLCHGRAGWSENLTDAKAFLEKVLGDNTIGYSQELQTRDWTSGYYLGSARFRLVRVEELLFNRPSRPELERLTFSGPGYRNRQETWESLYRRLAECVTELQGKSAGRAPQANNKSQRTRHGRRRDRR